MSVTFALDAIASAGWAIMSDLSPELQQLVSAGKLADRPTVADQERIFAALASRLPLATGPMVGAPTASGGLGENASALGRNLGAPAARKIVKTVGLTVAAVALLTTGYLGLRESPKLPHAGHPSVDFMPQGTAQGTVKGTEEGTVKGIDGAALAPKDVQQSQPSSPAVVAPQAAEPRSVPAVTSNARSTSREPTRTADSLAKEVAILSRAQTALHGGRADESLRILTEHAREFPRGILTEERRTTQIQALCALGRTNEANALLGRLSKQSVNGEAARQACATKR